MIGNTPELAGVPAGLNEDLPETVLNLPLPLFYSRDSGVALPTAALPYNDMRINFSFRGWRELLQAYELTLNDDDNCFTQKSVGCWCSRYYCRRTKIEWYWHWCTSMG